VICTVSRASIADVAKLMRDHHVGCVVVIDPPGSGIPVGIVTDRDIVVAAVAMNLDPRTLSAGEIMSPDVVTTTEEEDTAWAMKVMRDRGLRRLPVVDAEGEVVGIVTFEDLLGPASEAISDVVQAIGTERVVESHRRLPTRPAR
jgi:CBS domain-containing protein